MTGVPAVDGPVLIVEDNADLRDSMGMLLEAEGYEVTAASNGKEALQYLSKGLSPCLILLDLMMPIMNGWEFREAQRQEPQLALIPVVLLSAIDNSTERITSLAVAARLVKPVPPHVLLDKVQQHCRHG
jgi:CheY-like chemotaxis protein